MADSPTPETGTPESQSPARTPPALVTTEELLQSMVAKSPEATASPIETSPSGSVSRRVQMERYECLRAADAGHRLQGLRLPSEEELRAAALGGRPAVGPPRLPHQLSPALQSVLAGWRAVYESCRTGPVLQALVGECYAQDAVFEDALVSARGQEAVYRQFALLGAAVRAVQVAAYSLSVAPLSRPVVLLGGGRRGPPPGAPPPKAPSSLPPLPRFVQRPIPPSQSVGLQAIRSLCRQLQQEQTSQEKEEGEEAGLQGGQEGPGQQLHLTRVTVENVQYFELGLPQWMAWLVGGKAAAMQVHLYVTSILLVASDAPLALGPDLGSSLETAGLWPGDVTASRLAGAAAALARAGGVGLIDPAGAGAGGGVGSSPSWRIVHHVDIWHNVPMVWWRLRRALCVAVDALLAPLLLRG